MRWLLLASLLLAAPRASGQTLDLPDASLPDASVIDDGAERESEESDTGPSTCLSDRDCDRGLRCREGTCVYQRWREAEYRGCGAMGAVALPLVGLAYRRRGYRRVKRTK